MDSASGRGWATAGPDGSLDLTGLSNFWTSLDVCRTS